MVLGNVRLLVADVVGDNSTQTWVTGFSNVFACWYGPYVDIDNSALTMVNNSDDGTEGTAPGTIYWGTAITDGETVRVFALTSG